MLYLTMNYVPGSSVILFELLPIRSKIKDKLLKIKEYTMLVTLMAFISVIVILSEILEVIIVATYSSTAAAGLFMCKILYMFVNPHTIYLLLIYKESTKPSDSFIIIISVFVQLMISSLLPAFLLLLVYPIKIVSLFAYTVTSVSFVLYFMIALKGNVLHPNENILLRIYTIIFIVISLAFFSIFLFMMLFLLIMTKAAVFASSVYGVIPLLLPVSITSGIWLLKKQVFNKQETNDDTEFDKKTK